MAQGSRGRRLMGEINVVPYIDVMLVLLIIFMITAPLLTQGVKVDLPKAGAEPLRSATNPTRWCCRSIAPGGCISMSAPTRSWRSMMTRSRRAPRRHCVTTRSARCW